MKHLPFSVKDGFQRPLNRRLSREAFGAQAAIGTGFGYAGLGAGHLLSERMAQRVYQYGALRLGQNEVPPGWLGSGLGWARTFATAGLGVTEEHWENRAQDYWSASGPAAAPDTLTGPRPQPPPR